MNTRSRRLLGLLGGLVVAAGCLSAPAAADDLPCVPGRGCFFLSPSGNISCELDEAAPPGTQGSAAVAYCQSSTPTQSVSMDDRGTLTPCSGDTCMGDPPENTATLAYGQTARLGAFSCLSETSGMTCTVPSGRGFTISRSGIAPVG
jgi:hypothetical protein